MDANTVDLPATQKQASLAPYQQGLPMGMPMDDDLGGGNFSVLGLLHSVRRQLLPSLLAGICLATLLAGILWFLIPVNYVAEAYLQVNREMFQGTANDFMIFKETQGSLLKSTFVVSRALSDPEISEMDLVRNNDHGWARKRPATWLSGAIQVTMDEDELVYVTMKGRDKKQTEKVMNAVIDAYKAEVVTKERMQKVEELSKLRARNQKVQDTIASETDAIRKLAEAVGGMSSAAIQRDQAMKLEELRQSQRELDRLTRMAMEAETKYMLLQQEVNFSTKNRVTENMILDELDRDRAYYELGLEIQKMKDYLQMMDGRVPAGSLEIQQVTEQVGFMEQKRKEMATKLRPRIVERLQNRDEISPEAAVKERELQKIVVANLRRQLTAYREIYEQRRAEMEKFGGDSGELVARQRVVEALTRDLNTVREAMSELEMELDSRDRVQIIQAPYVSKPSTLFGKVVQIAGGWAVTFLGVIAAIAYWDYLGNKVNGAQDMSKSNRVIGTLPCIQNFKGDITEPMKLSADAIRTAILYNRAIPSQAILVTSATGQEGRSTVASQLALSMARAGKTTLLIDADLRNPQQHTAFALQPQGGLGDMLRGDMTSDQAIVPTSVENVWLLSTGRCDQHALRGLAGEQARTIFEDFRARFDVIIIDGSPVLTSPDALLIGQHADAAVLAVRRDVSQVPKVNAACEQLTSVGVPIIGSVLNGGTIEKRGGGPLISNETTEEEEETPALANA